MCKTKNKIWRKVMSFVLAVAMVAAYYMPEVNVTKVKADGETPTGYLTEIKDELGDIDDNWYIKLDEKGQGFYDTITNESTYNNSYTTEETALEIGTAQELAAFAKAVNDGNNFAGKFVRLTADIDLGGKGFAFSETDIDESTGNFAVTLERNGTPECLWRPIGDSEKPFRGTFDGCGHAVSSMLALADHVVPTFASGQSGAAQMVTESGLFGYLTGASVRGLSVCGYALAVSLSGGWSGGGGNLC